MFSTSNDDGSRASYHSPTKNESDPYSRTNSVSSCSRSNAFPRNDYIEINNNSDSNSSTDNSHGRRVALMMASPGRPPRSNSSREKQRRRVRPPSRRASGSASNSLPHSESYDNHKAPSPVANRRRSSKSLSGAVSPSHRRRISSDKSHLSEYSTTELSSESSPDTSPSRLLSDMYRLDHGDLSPYKLRQSSSRLSLSSQKRSGSGNESIPGYSDSYHPKSTTRKSPTKNPPPPRDLKSVRTKSTTGSKSISLTGSFFGIIIISMLGMVILTRKAAPMRDKYFDEKYFTRPTVRGKQVLMEQLGTSVMESEEKYSGVLKLVGSEHTENVKRTRYSALSTNNAAGNKSQPETTKMPYGGTTFLPDLLKMRVPPSASLQVQPKFDIVDRNIYYLSKSSTAVKENDSHPRTVMLDHAVKQLSRKIETYPADFTDNTQFYGLFDSDDERLNKMEMREPYSKDECVPMQEWQTAYQPSCNGMHELALQTLGASNRTSNSIAEPEGLNATLFGTKGFWRYAWKLVIGHHDKKEAEEDTIVFKNLKYEHNFEDAHFEHDRVDAVAMERLTSSPHVINIFGFCGHSVLTEYADGKRVGQLADKARKIPLKRLEIARDIAHGLADVHGIDGDGNATFVHLDVNPANVVSVNGTLKLNDFNIGIIRQWNTTSNEPCGFPAQYPNPQWRSPEEARNEQHLTEKVDVFSLGHIFFRLICGHEPWNKLEPGGKPSKAEIDVKVKRGDLPFIPESVLTSDDPEVVAIRDVMLKCYSFDPTERPSARQIANVLDRVYGLLKERYASKPPKEKKTKKKKKPKAEAKTA